MKTFTFPKQSVASVVKEMKSNNGSVNLETGRFEPNVKSPYGDNDMFYSMLVMGDCEFPWQNEFPPEYNFVMETDPPQLHTFAKESNLQERLEFIKKSNSILEGPTKYQPVTENSYLVVNELRLEQNDLVVPIFEKLLSGYDKVEVPISLDHYELYRPTSRSTYFAPSWVLKGSYDIYYDFENVDYIMLDEEKVSAKNFTENSPLIQSLIPYTQITLHRKKVKKPFVFKAAMVNQNNPEFRFIRDKKGEYTFGNVHYSNGMINVK